MGGHDDNLMSVLSALKVKDTPLSYSLNKRSPIGSNLEFSKWKNEKGEEFIKISLIYLTANQLRNFDEITIDNPPMTFELEFERLTKNKDGMYKLLDIIQRFDEAISQYDRWN